MAKKSDRTGTRPELPHASNAVSKIKEGGYKIALRRTSKEISITLTAADEYSSIELYDHLLNSVKNGSLHLEMDFLAN